MQFVDEAISAVRAGHLETLEQLCQARPELIWVVVKEARKSERALDVLQWACSLDEFIKEEVFLQMCLNNRLDILPLIDLQTPPAHALVLSSFAGHLDVVQYLTERWEWDLLGAIQAASQRGHTRVIKYLTAKLNLLIDKQ